LRIRVYRRIPDQSVGTRGCMGVAGKDNRGEKRRNFFIAPDSYLEVVLKDYFCLE
jgi:hypothetical protein